VHERDRFSDFLLIVLRELLPRLKMLKIVLMSAALNVQLFYSYFGGCPVISGICFSKLYVRYGDCAGNTVEENSSVFS